MYLVNKNKTKVKKKKKKIELKEQKEIKNCLELE